MFDSFLFDDKISICFHKSCVDGLFATIIVLNRLRSINYSYSDFVLIPLSPSEITNRTQKIQQLENKKKIILDLPYFGTNIEFFFDHHITNRKTIPSSGYHGLFDDSAASTCSVLAKYFKILDKPQIERLITIASVIDQAKFSTSPPESGPLKVDSMDDIIWACNDLIKDIRDNDQLIKLIDTFELSDIETWIIKHEKNILNYRRRRQETLNIKNRIKKTPIVIIINNSHVIQAEGLHFALTAEEKNYKMLILFDKLKKLESSKLDDYKITFRLNPFLNESWTDKLRVDGVAHELGGGGHKGAASASISQLSIGYNRIMKWVQNLKKYFDTEEYFSETNL